MAATPTLSGSTYLLLIMLCIGAGAALSTQSGVNARLSAAVQSPMLAALISFAVGTLSLAIMSLLLDQYRPLGPAFSQLPLWAWCGGILGAFVVATMVYAAPQVGALVLVSGIVLGQVTASLILDQFGLLGFPQIDISPQRLIGAVMIVGGLWLVANK